MKKSLSYLSLAAVCGTAALTASAAVAALSATFAECGTTQLSAHFTPGSPGAGQRYATLTLTNRSAGTCRTGGYVGLGLLNGRGHEVATNAERIDLAAVRTVYLRPGAKATSQMHWSVVNGTGDTSTGPCFRAPSSILVTPPNSYKSLRLPWRMGTVCEQGTIQITPLAI